MNNEISTTISRIKSLLCKKQIENSSDERLLIKAISDYETRSECSAGTLKWMNAVIERKGKKFEAT
mgnify:CR=1 FL=1